MAVDKNDARHLGDSTLVTLRQQAVRMAGKGMSRKHIGGLLGVHRNTVGPYSYEERFTAEVFIRFLRRLIEDTDAKVFLIVDNLRVHHARKLREWMAARRDRIELFYLPFYSPKLNPDEYLNNDLKGGIRRAPAASNCDELKKQVDSHLRMLQNARNGCRRIFGIPKSAMRPDQSPYICWLG